jgi:hypothetical protein
MPRRKRKKKKSRYHTGVHDSPKAGECKYRSGWELSYMKHLDADPHVIYYSYENVKIDYVSNAKTGRTRTYFPDFLVEYDNGEFYLDEVKPRNKLDRPTVKRKLAAAREWCSKRDVNLRVITEVELRSYGVL